MSAIAFLFPGQGSQQVGMGQALAQEDASARALFAEADAVLGYSLSELCFQGPEDALQQTQHTQPALYVAGCACADWLCARGVAPSVAAGHSVGEYAALYVAGAVDFATGLRLLDERARAMRRAGAEKGGSMMAVLGVHRDVVEATCRDAAQGQVLSIAGYNTPSQTVISGEQVALDRAATALKLQGAKRIVSLRVSGAFHSRLMAGAAEHLRGVLQQQPLRDARIPVITNASAQPVTAAATLAEHLVAQLVQPVRWVETVDHLAKMGVTHAVELGPGKVIQGLLKACNCALPCWSAGDPESLGRVVEELTGSP